jgi:hypothetical protein
MIPSIARQDNHEARLPQDAKGSNLTGIMQSYINQPLKISDRRLHELPKLPADFTSAG